MPLDNSPRFKMLELDTTVSTNTFLRDYRPLHLPEVTLVTADYQTGGRGQTGNSWESDSGQNLLFSLLLQPTFLDADHVFALSEALALAVRETVEAALWNPGKFLSPYSPDVPQDFGEHPSFPFFKPPVVAVKWPNDIYVDEKKIAGILIENEFAGSHLSQSILGCGLNVNQTDFEFPCTSAFSPDTMALPTSLARFSGFLFERSLVLDAIVEKFLALYSDLQAGKFADIHDMFSVQLYRRTGKHPFADSNGSFRASISHVDPDGHIVLCDEDHQLRRYSFKEVSFIHE